MENKIERLIAYVDQLLVTDDKVTYMNPIKTRLNPFNQKTFF